MRVLVGAVALALAGCVTPDTTPPVAIADPCSPIVLVPAADATAAERAAVIAAASMWDDVAATRFAMDDIDGAPRLAVRFASAPLAFFGAYEAERADIVLNRDLPTDALREIAMAHELGHAMGLVHVTDRDSVMNPGNVTIAPNAADAAALAALWGACPR